MFGMCCKLVLCCIDDLLLLVWGYCEGGIVQVCVGFDFDKSDQLVMVCDDVDFVMGGMILFGENVVVFGYEVGCGMGFGGDFGLECGDVFG